MSSKFITLHNGVRMPTLGYGTWLSNGDPLRTGLKKALDVGYRHVDTAYLYGNEDIVGDVLKQWFASGSGKREDVFITTKLSAKYHRRLDVERSLKESLEMLQLDYVDLFLIHTPMGNKCSDERTMDIVNERCVPDPVDHLETWKGMEDVLNKGLTRAIGLSNFSIPQMQRILDNCSVKPHNIQVECHLYWPQFELHDFCKKHNISFTAYAPLGSPGRLTHPLTIIGMDVSKQSDPLNDTLVKDIAAKHGKSSGQVLLKWLLQRDMIVIPKSTSPAHILENFQLFDFELSSEEMKMLNEMSSKCVTLHNGVLMPMLGYGTWLAEGELLYNGLKKALDVGYRHIDTAYVYENEDIIGDVLKQWFDSGSGKREDIFITTKLSPNYHQRPDVERSLKESLERLKLNHVDLFLIHTPVGSKRSDGRITEAADRVDPLETWKGMEDVLNKGLTRAIGLSNFSVSQTQRILDRCSVKPHNVQVECHIYWPQFELHGFCKEQNISFTAYTSLGNPGRHARLRARIGANVTKLEEPLNDTTVKDIAAKHGKSPAQILLKWVLQRDMIVIPKSTTAAHIVENFQLFDFELSNDEMRSISHCNELLPYAMSSKCVTLHNGLPMPMVGYGTWQGEGDALRAGLKKALEVGYRLIDTAYIYENEDVIGEVLQQWLASGSGKREDLFVTTKLPMHNHRRPDVQRSLKESLERLKLDYVDLFLVHTPVSSKSSNGRRIDLVNDHCIPDDVDHLETWKGMEDVLSEGLTRSIGLSNFNIAQMVRIMDNCTVKPHNLQVECHLYWPQFELHEFCKRHNISFTAYGPIGSPGRRNHPMARIGVDVSLVPVVLMKWLLQRDIIVIPKSTNPSHIASNLQLFDFELNDAEMKALNEVQIRERIFPFYWSVYQDKRACSFLVQLRFFAPVDLPAVLASYAMPSKCVTLHNALEVGYRHIDTAYVYENEDVIGEVLQQWFASGSGKREDLFVTTKLPMHNHRRPDVQRSLKESLERLKLDYVDLFLVHTPLSAKASDGRRMDLVNDHCIPDNVDHLETWKGMEDVLNEGLTRSIGLSNFNIAQMVRIMDSCTVKPHNLQVECHLYWPQFELYEFCKRHNISFTAYSPIGSPGRRVIPKSTNPSHIASNFQLFDFELNEAEMKALNEVQIRERIFPFYWAKNHPDYPFVHLNVSALVSSGRINASAFLLPFCFFAAVALPCLPVQATYAMSSKCVTLHNGLRMPMVGYGTWQGKGDALRAGLRKALEVGYRLIDTAYVYENEDVIGEVLQQWLASGSGKREDLFVTTKLAMHRHRRADVERSLRESLERFKLDYVDLFLVHAPLSAKSSDGRAIDMVNDHCIPDVVDHLETWKGMEDVLSKGLTRSIGLSNFNIAQMTRIMDNCTVKPHNVQVECHLYWPQFEIHEFCKQRNISLTGYSPLGSPGRASHPVSHIGVDVSDEKVKQEILMFHSLRKQRQPMDDPLAKQIATKHGKSVAQVLLKWLVQRGIVVIPMSTIASQIVSNLQLFDFTFDDAEMKALNAVQIRERIFPFYWCQRISISYAVSSKYVTLHNGVLMPMVGYGTWQAHGDALRSGLRKALEVGYRHIDTAYIYQNEDVIGEVLQQWFASGSGKREDVFVTTKLPWHSRRRDDVERSLKESLARLKLDYVDLYLVHTPQRGAASYGKAANLEIWKGMEDVFSKGLARSIGLSNFNIDQIVSIMDNSKVKPHNLQVECHLYWPQFELLEFCKRHNISFTAYSPLGSPGRRSRLPSVLLKWLLQRDIIVIPKSTTPSYIISNFELSDFELTGAEMKALNEVKIREQFFRQRSVHVTHLKDGTISKPAFLKHWALSRLRH
ncbi:hypothetical protein M513_01386 [Trichuris suis]|uniref:NADP-dependent oxidoreductase domain-containing protein n=1 Tax=Trichuris suis TaxID=68888 RepID=A0A085MKH0_9BILA|nr:hypothetical protein M513_01386 [Trichuris suis]